MISGQYTEEDASYSHRRRGRPRQTNDFPPVVLSCLPGRALPIALAGLFQYSRAKFSEMMATEASVESVACSSRLWRQISSSSPGLRCTCVAERSPADCTRVVAIISENFARGILEQPCQRNREARPGSTTDDWRKSLVLSRTSTTTV